MTNTDLEQVQRWLHDFAALVRGCDFDAAMEMFDEDVLGFGSVARHASGVHMLRREQWERIWPVTRGFQFDEEGRQVQVSGDLAWVASTWSSEGLDETGGTFLRDGRVTIILERAGNGEWKAVHTHYSVYPTLPARP